MLEKYIGAAARRIKCTLVLKNATYIDVFTATLRRGDIGVYGDKIVGVGEYRGETELDCGGYIVAPGFINGHVHIESSLLSPEGFASLVVPRGTTTVVADPHEITNVCGLAGAEYIKKAGQNVPLDIKLMLPSCVPATPFETSGATLSSGDICGAMDNFYGLGEFMNYPAVAGGDGEAVKKLEAALTRGKIVDGHAPALTGEELNAYLCGGISTDHECCSQAEIDEKLSKGMYIHIRHGASTRNLGNAKYITDGNFRRFLFCTDDRPAAALKEEGDIDDALRKTVRQGLDPVKAVICATLNAAECYRINYVGAVAPFYAADLVVLDNLENFSAKWVIKGGEIVAKDGAPLFCGKAAYLPAAVKDTVHIPDLSPDDFKIPIKKGRARAITIRAGSIITDCEEVNLKCGPDVSVAGSDLLKLAVIERHKGTGNIGKGFLKGYGFSGGALGVTISHDSHNAIIAGDDNAAMCRAALELKRIGGGMVIAQTDGGVYSLALDIAGLMSSASASEVVKNSQNLISLAKKMGVKPQYEAFMSLAFLSLAVVPKLKLLDTGLFDVENFKFIDLEA